MKSCLVIGAGIAGLAAARKLHAAGLQVTVLDKGRGVGGRLATRRIVDGVFDHGAQFVTVRSPAFSRMMEEMLADGAIYEWCRGIGTLAARVKDDGHPRYQGTGGMSCKKKFLSRSSLEKGLLQTRPFTMLLKAKVALGSGPKAM